MEYYIQWWKSSKTIYNQMNESHNMIQSERSRHEKVSTIQFYEISKNRWNQRVEIELRREES